MKCQGCIQGLPKIGAFVGVGNFRVQSVDLHYHPGSEQPAGLCTAPMMDAIADEVVTWEGEGGRAA